MSTYLNIQDAVIKEPAARSWALSCCIASCILSTLTVFILLGNRFALPIPKINDVDIGADRTGEFELTLITNNKNDYLCSADFVYNDVNTHGDIYAFACAQVTSSENDTATRTEMDLECLPGFSLSCLVGATYGNTAGACTELTTAVFGCGVPFDDSPISCLDDSILCAEEVGDGSEFLQCENVDNNMMVDAIPGCGDCASVCLCGMDAPMFYNTADCFGDRYSTVCTGEEGDYDEYSVYLPPSVWERDCVGQQSCTLTLSNNTHSCEDDTGTTNYYYQNINGEHFEDSEDVINNFLSDCGIMDLKLLAVCQVDGS